MVKIYAGIDLLYSPKLSRIHRLLHIFQHNKFSYFEEVNAVWADDATGLSLKHFSLKWTDGLGRTKRKGLIHVFPVYICTDFDSEQAIQAAAGGSFFSPGVLVVRVGSTPA